MFEDTLTLLWIKFGLLMTDCYAHKEERLRVKADSLNQYDLRGT
jgi:hypothetical protein